MKRLVCLLAAFALAFCGLAAGCGKTPDTIAFYMPDGAPALAAAKGMADEAAAPKGVAFTVLPSAQIQKVASDKPGVAIVPVNLASKLVKQGYKIAAVVTHGNLFLLGKQQAETASDLAGKTVSVVSLNAIPGLTLRVVLNKAGVAVGENALKAATDAGAAATALAQGDVDFALVPEPAATAQINKHNSAAADAEKWVKSDVQALYKATFATEASYPQAVLIVKDELAADKAFLASLAGMFEGVNDWLKANTARAIEAIVAHLAPGSDPSMTASQFSAPVIDGCNIAYVPALGAKAGIAAYLEALVTLDETTANAALTDADFVA